MNCWYCHWGWAKPVADIYKEACKRLGGATNPLHFGPSHIVWEDENFADSHVQFCLDNFDKLADNLTAHEKEVVYWSLSALLEIPENQRDIWPDDYDGENPENYPPTCEVVKI